MTGDVNFSGKLAKNIDLNAVTVEGMSAEKKAKIDEIFNTVTGGTSANTLTTDELVVLFDVDSNHDGKITDDEAKAAYDKLADDVKQGLTSKQVTQNDYVAYLKAMARKNEELIAQDSNVGNSYTIQLGEDLDDLVDRVIAANNIPDDKKADIKEKYKAAIIEANKTNGAIKFDNNGNVQWLVAGTKIIIPTMTEDERADKRVKDQNNKTAVENKYRAWRAGKIQSFRYSIDANGQASEVRSSGSTNFDVTKDYDVSTGQQVGSSGGSGGLGGSDEPLSESDKLDMSRIILVGKITEEDCVDVGDSAKKYDFAEVKAKAEKGRDILAKLNNPGEIKSCTAGSEKYNNNQVKWYTIEFKDESKIEIQMSESGDIVGMYSVDSDGNDLIKINSSGTLYVEMNDTNDVFDVKINGAVKDFDKLVTLVKKSNKVREAMGLSSTDFVNYDKIIDEEMPDGVTASEVKDKIKLANSVITKLENSSEVKEVKSKDKDGGKKELTITLKDETVVKAEVGSDGKVKKVIIQYKDSSAPDVTYDLENGDITVKINNQDVTTTSVIKNKGKEAIGKFVLDAKTANGVVTEDEQISELPYNINHYETEGNELGEMLYNQVKGSSNDSTTRKLLHQIKEQNVHSVVNKFNSLSPNEHIIKYLVNESGITNADLTWVVTTVMNNAFAYGLENTNEYKDLEEFNTYIHDHEHENDDPSDEDWAEEVDNAVEAMLTLIKQAADEKGKQYEVSDITASENYVRSQKSKGRDIGLRLYNEVHGSSNAKDTLSILREIQANNVYYVIERFNEKSPKENIIKYLVNESGIKYRNLTFVITNALNCAKEYGLENTKEYQDVQAYKTFCLNDNNKDKDASDTEWADRVDKALKVLMSKVKEQAATNNENL